VNEEVLHGVKEERNVVHTIKSRIGHRLRRICLLKHSTKGQVEREIEVTEIKGRRRKQLLDARILEIVRGSTRSCSLEVTMNQG
jgi:hypothetical protein